MMKLAAVCLALLCLAAAAEAASVGPWATFNQRLQDAAGGVQTASAGSSAYGGYYEHAIRVSLPDAGWRDCGFGLRFFGQWDFGCSSHDDPYDSRYGAGGFMPNRFPPCMTCSIALDLDVFAIIKFERTGGLSANIGRANGHCYTTTLADGYGAPMCSGMALTLDGDVNLAFARSNTGNVQPPAEEFCNILVEAIADNVEELLPDSIGFKADLTAFLGQRGSKSASNIDSKLAAKSKVLKHVMTGGRAARAASEATAATANSDGYYDNAENFGLAVVVSGVTTVANAKADEDIKNGGLFEYTPFFVLEDPNDRRSSTRFLWPENFVVPNPASTPYVTPGFLHLGMFA